MVYCRNVLDEKDPMTGLKTDSAKRNLESKERIMKLFEDNKDANHITLYIVRGLGSARVGTTPSIEKTFGDKFNFFHINARLGWFSRMLDTAVYLERFLLRYLDKEKNKVVTDTDFILKDPNITKVIFREYTLNQYNMSNPDTQQNEVININNNITHQIFDDEFDAAIATEGEGKRKVMKNINPKVKGIKIP